ncbi:lactonase family protein [Mangrovibacterium sp.]|uniref:lactonase family protein n=1 Tax=Mangrovibacterium sp. TaxID=1961364 RepID=UPI00356B1C78
MKFNLLSVICLFVLLQACQPVDPSIRLYVGTYSVDDSDGIYAYKFNPENGELVFDQVTENRENPSFIGISRNNRFLYAVSEVNDYNHLDSGSVTAYGIEPDGRLTKLNQVATLGNHPCHIAVAPDGETMVASNYTSGSISIYQVKPDGSLVENPQLIQHVGFGPDSQRQKGPHAHSAQFSDDGKTIMTADLGLDKLFFYQFNADSGKYIPAQQPFVEMAPGAGPRHFARSADDSFIYVMNEMASTVSVVKKVNDGWELVQTESSLPADYTGSKSGADIHLSADGRFLYCSNRGLNSIAVFKRDLENGTIELIQNEPEQGEWPRNFCISPDGNYVLVAYQHSNNVAVFSRDAETGLLTYTGKSYDIPSPVCLKFLN